MSPNHNANKNLLDVRIILSGLWAARMLSGLQGDTMRLHDPDALRGILAGTGAVIISTNLLLIMSIIFVFPILMSFLSLIIKYPTNRTANLIAGIFFALFDLVFLVLSIFVWHSTSYELVWSFMYLICTGLVVWYSVKWPKQEA